MKKFALIFSLSIMTLGMSGCISIPPLDFTPADITFSQEKIPAEAKSVNVAYAKKEESMGDIDVGPTGSSSEGDNFLNAYQRGLSSAIDQSGLFMDNADMKIAVYATILKFDTPPLSIHFKTECISRYRLQNRATGEIILDETISSTGEVPGDYAFAEITRAIEARNRSIRNNISKFIDVLKESSLVKH